MHLASFWNWGFWNSEVACRPRCTWKVKKTWLTGDALPVFVYFIRGNDNNNKKENIYLAGFLKTLPPDGLFRSVAIIKTKSATTSFFLFSSFLPPRSFFSSFPFPSLEWFWSWSRTKNLPFDAFSLKMTANFVKLVFKKSARCTSHEL